MDKKALYDLKREILMLLHYQQKENKSYEELLKLGIARAKKYGADLRDIGQMITWLEHQEKQ